MEEVLSNIHRVYMMFRPGEALVLSFKEYRDNESELINLVAMGNIKRDDSLMGKKRSNENYRAFIMTGKNFYPSVLFVVGSNPGITVERLIKLRCSKHTIRTFISDGKVIVKDGGLYLPEHVSEDFGVSPLTKYFNDLLMPVRIKWSAQ